MKKSLIITFISVISLLGNAQSLEEYFMIAAKNNPGLKAKYKSFEASLERISQATGLQDPTFSFGYFVSPVETRVGPQRVRLSLTQMFPWFGTLKASGDVAAIQAEAQYQTFLEAKNRLYFQVAAAYYPIYELQQWRTLEEENIQILESYKTIATSKYEHNQGSLVDVLRADLMLKDAHTTLEILTKKKQPLLSAFNTLLNREATIDVETPDTLYTMTHTFYRDSLSNNPLVSELDLNIKASELEEVLAKKRGLPNIGVGLDYLIVSELDDQAFNDNGKNAFMPQISIGIPIYRGKYRAARKQAQLKQESYLFEKEDRINQLTANYDMAEFERDQHTDLISLYDQQIEETQQVLNLLLSAYGNSGKDFEEVLRVQQQFLKYRKMKATAIKDRSIAIAKLNYITAKGY